ncbi:MAG: DegT/DnrJ/EryC1/StrS family aminotransferase [Burkholderiales bacterium]
MAGESAALRREVPYVNIGAQYEEEREALLPVIEVVLRSGIYIGGEAVERLEGELAAFTGVKHAVALNSGTDALVIALAALGVGSGDEVITPPNSFVASTAVIAHLRAKPVFVDVLPDQNIDPAQIEAAITPRTRAIMPVHLTGRMARMDEIMAIAARHKLAVVEDAAQAIGSKYAGRMSGSYGDVGCFSAHPLKNFNACGDGGFLTTNDERIAAAARSMRNHGLIDRNTVERFGFVSRMDTLQAAILRYRLTRLGRITEQRRGNAALYDRLLQRKAVFVPPEAPKEFNTYHTYVIQADRRDELQKYLASRGVGTAIHYPVPIHLQPAARDLGCREGQFPATERQARRILTLPVNQTLSAADVEHVARCVNDFFNS